MTKSYPMLLAGAALLWGVPAVAQTAAGAAPDAGQAGTPTAPTDQTTADPNQLEDIVVTAQRREQSLQQVPISVTAFNAASIAALSAETIGDLDTFTPGLTINDSSVTQPSFTIRGVATDDFGIGTDPSVGIFIDGIYSGRSGSSLIFFNDINRVEVLKGPQGTLFGRNTSAGAISIVTNKPTDKRELSGTIQTGNYKKIRADATLNVPLTDTLYLRLNGVSNYRDGFLKDASGRRREGENNKSGRAALRWAPTDATDFVLAYDHDNTAKDGPFAIGISSNALSTDPRGPYANDVRDDKETRLLNAVSFTGTHHSGPFTLTSISSFKHFETHNREDEDGTANPRLYLDTENIEKNSSLYQELRIGFDNYRLSAIAGASFFHERGRQTSAVTLLSDSVDNLLGAVADFPIFTILDSVGIPGVFGQQFREDMNNRAANDSYAAFGDATFKVTSRLSLTAGIRYTHDLKKFTWLNGGFTGGGLETTTAPGALYNAIVGAPLFPGGAQISVADFFRATVGPNGLIFDEGALEGVSFTRRETFNDVSPRFVVQYDVTPDVHAYASATRGYKAGGFNSVQINSFFAPENVWNFEGGLKTELFDRRVRFNASGYYFKYKNRQSISLEDTGGTLPQYITRSGDSEAYGVDLETQFVVSPDFSLGLTAGLIESKWVKRIEQGVDISGQPTGEPSFRGVASGHYHHQFASGSIFADASYSYTSRQRINDATRFTDAAIAPFVDFSKLGALRSARDIVNAKIGWRSPGDQISIAAYAENLLDKRYYRTLNTISADIFQTPYVRAERPGFYGVELGLRF